MSVIQIWGRLLLTFESYRAIVRNTTNPTATMTDGWIWFMILSCWYDLIIIWVDETGIKTPGGCRPATAANQCSNDRYKTSSYVFSVWIETRHVQRSPSFKGIIFVVVVVVVLPHPHPQLKVRTTLGNQLPHQCAAAGLSSRMQCDFCAVYFYGWSYSLVFLVTRGLRQICVCSRMYFSEVHWGFTSTTTAENGYGRQHAHGYLRLMIFKNQNHDGLAEFIWQLMSAKLSFGCRGTVLLCAPPPSVSGARSRNPKDDSLSSKNYLLLLA